MRKHSVACVSTIHKSVSALLILSLLVQSIYSSIPDSIADSCSLSSSMDVLHGSNTSDISYTKENLELVQASEDFNVLENPSLNYNLCEEAEESVIERNDELPTKMKNEKCSASFLLQLNARLLNFKTQIETSWNELKNQMKIHRTEVKPEGTESMASLEENCQLVPEKKEQINETSDLFEQVERMYQFLIEVPIANFETKMEKTTNSESDLENEMSVLELNVTTFMSTLQTLLLSKEMKPEDVIVKDTKLDSSNVDVPKPDDAKLNHRISKHSKSRPWYRKFFCAMPQKNKK